MPQLHIKSIDQNVDAPLFEISLVDWVYTIHSNISTKYDMRAITIEKGDFGFESYACVLLSILKHITGDHIRKYIKGTLEKTAFIELAHAAWSNNYVYWKNDNYSAVSKKGIHTNQRNHRCCTTADNIDQSDKDLYEDIIHDVFAILAQQVLNAGIQKMEI